MRRSLRSLCSKIDLDGIPSKYYPRFRPRRLVMPVDPSDVHSSRRQPNPLFEAHKAHTRRRRQAERRGAVQLGTVPSERSVGDAFRIMLDACAMQRLFSAADLTPQPVRELESLVSAHHYHHLAHNTSKAATRSGGAAGGEAGEKPAMAVVASPLYAIAFQSPPPPPSPSISPGAAAAAMGSEAARALTVREVDGLWAMLNRTPLNSPVHGALALRGEALVRSTLLELAYAGYPRLRSRHVQQLLHETTGLLPCGRAAIRLGLAEQCGVDGDIGMWRELNMLSERVRVARRQAAAHLQRVQKGVPAQRRWYWRGVLRSASARLRLFPVHREDLQPRLEWVRSLLYAFIAFAEVAEESGDTQVRVVPLIHQLFASQLARHVRRRQVLDAAEAVAAGAQAATAAPHGSLSYLCRDAVPQGTGTAEGEQAKGVDSAEAESAQRVAAELRRVLLRTEDEEEVMEGRTHPMNQRADRKREQFESSGGAHSTQSLLDEGLARHAEQHRRLAPPLLLHALEATTMNAFKEAQLILRYAPEVSPTLRNAPIDVDQSVRRVVDVQETNNYASLHHAQQYRQVEHTVCRLYAGRHCLGEGKGETLMAAMQDASLEMLFRYYLRPPTAAPLPMENQADATEASSAQSGEGTSEGGGAGIPAARVRPPRTEEEILL